ncbi:hypothetical protein BDM02DRAFT_3115369 [Thelephora ganbajun]|uniref:Uncharacterized protein n=1 Tax=Thelephora ganbajun TaxID=370292 RepID=A0ACB6ZFX9_THEGA|nr:hypothetical protein BDM02DRAFT_3115369 [Thelephora ganbajun]
MSLTITPSYHLVNIGSCRVHGVLNCPYPSCTTSYVVSPGVSPTFTAVALPSPCVTVSPLPAVSPLPSLAVVNFQSPCSRNSPSPVIPVLLLPQTPQVNPLVASNSDVCRQKVHYDVSEDPSTARVSTLLGLSAPISYEQKSSLVIEGVPHGAFRIVFDHPALTSTIKFEGSLTIGELLKQLYSHLHKQVGSREMSTLKEDRNFYTVAVKTQSKRCGAAFDARAEWNQGIKRVDVLGKECQFRGVYLGTSPINDRITLHVVFGK